MTQSDREQVWSLMEKIGFCMLAAHDGEVIRARPMAAYPDRDESAIYFLTDANSHKEEAVRSDPDVCLAFADAGDQTYVSVTGRASVSNDRDKIRDLWSTPAKAWWDNADDPSIRVLRVTPVDAQYWDSPGTVVSYIKMAAAVVSDARPAVGDNTKTNM